MNDITIIFTLAGVIAVLAGYIRWQHVEHRKDQKENRDLLLKVAQDSTTAMTKNAEATDHLGKAIDQVMLNITLATKRK